MAERRPPLRVAPVPAAAAQHAPVCASCGESWPCPERKAANALIWEERRLAHDCWACGKPAKSPTGFGVVIPGRGIVLSRWCGPAKHRSCSQTGWLYREADLRARTLTEARGG